MGNAKGDIKSGFDAQTYAFLRAKGQDVSQPQNKASDSEHLDEGLAAETIQPLLL
jgi:hypothetical protein